jgi:MraZ protein
MLIGQYSHVMDDKNRLSLPSKFRKELGASVVVTRGLDRCLFVYPVKAWKEFTQKLGELSMGQAEARGFSRHMLSGAAEVEIDKSGRVLVPDHLKAFAGLSTKVIVAGVSARVEIWDEAAWATYIARVEGEADTLAEHLGQIGMI